MKTKQKIDTVINTFLIVIALLIILLAVLKYSNVKLIFLIVMFSYAILNLLQFLLTKESKDYEGLYTFLASMAVGVIDIFFSFDSKNVLPITIMIEKIKYGS